MTATPNRSIIIYSSRYGGPYNQYKLLASEFRACGHDVKLYNAALPMLRSLLFERKDVIISLVPLPFRFGAKTYLLNIKGEYPHERHLIRNPLAYLYPLAIRRADRVVVPSLFIKKRLHLANATIIPNGAVTVAATPKPQKPLRLVTATSFAFEDKARGVLTLIRGLAQQDYPTPVVYDIYGAGTFLERIKDEAAAIALPKNLTVTFRGHTSELQHELLRCDAFLYWSVHDNFPNAVIEALGLGLPVLTNNVGAIPEMMPQGTGIIASNVSLASDLRKLLKSAPLRSRLGAAARAHVKKRFAIDRVAAAWLSIINVRY